MPAFALYTDDILVKIDIRNIESAQFRHPYTGRVKRFKHGTIA